MVWDATCLDTLPLSYTAFAVRDAGEEAERKKHSHLLATYHFVPVAVESLGVLGPEACVFLRDLGCRLMATMMKPLSYWHLL